MSFGRISDQVVRKDVVGCLQLRSGGKVFRSKRQTVGSHKRAPIGLIHINGSREHVLPAPGKRGLVVRYSDLRAGWVGSDGRGGGQAIWACRVRATPACCTATLLDEFLAR